MSIAVYFQQKNASKFNYTLNSQYITPTDEHDYLSVRCRRDLRWSSHCSKVSSRANKSLGLLRRTLKPCSERVKEQAYLSVVRPITEYAVPVWSPLTNRDVNKIEQVQKNAARFVKNDYNPYTSTSGLVSSLGWVSPEHRLLLAQASLFYKIQNRLVNISFPSCIQENLRAIRFNLNKYKQLNSNILTYSYSFFPKAVRNWNCLPTSVVSAPNTNHLNLPPYSAFPTSEYHICDDPKPADSPPRILAKAINREHYLRIKTNKCKKDV